MGLHRVGLAIKKSCTSQEEGGSRWLGSRKCSHLESVDTPAALLARRRLRCCFLTYRQMQHPPAIRPRSTSSPSATASQSHHSCHAGLLPDPACAPAAASPADGLDGGGGGGEEPTDSIDAPAPPAPGAGGTPDWLVPEMPLAAALGAPSRGWLTSNGVGDGASVGISPVDAAVSAMAGLCPELSGRPGASSMVAEDWFGGDAGDSSSTPVLGVWVAEPGVGARDGPSAVG